MSTEELLAVLEDGAAAMAAAAPERRPERRLQLVPPPAPEAPAAQPAPPVATPAAPARALWTPAPAPVPRGGLRRRLRCARHGHDPRPHRPLPHDEVVYRCLRCGRPAAPPQRP